MAPALTLFTYLFVPLPVLRFSPWFNKQPLEGPFPCLPVPGPPTSGKVLSTVLQPGAGIGFLPSSWRPLVCAQTGCLHPLEELFSPYLLNLPLPLALPGPCLGCKSLFLSQIKRGRNQRSTYRKGEAIRESFLHAVALQRPGLRTKTASEYC